MKDYESSCDSEVKFFENSQRQRDRLGETKSKKQTRMSYLRKKEHCIQKKDLRKRTQMSCS